MNALLSIKPKFGEKILDGEKKYEFRRTAFSDPSSVETIIMYASAPVQRIIGFFSFVDIIEGRPEDLWAKFKDRSGICNRDQFMAYFSGKETGFAIEINEAISLQNPVDPRDHYDAFRPPVSFRYVNGEFSFIFDQQR